MRMNPTTGREKEKEHMHGPIHPRKNPKSHRKFGHRPATNTPSLHDKMPRSATRTPATGDQKKEAKKNMTKFNRTNNHTNYYNPLEHSVPLCAQRFSIRRRSTLASATTHPKPTEPKTTMEFDTHAASNILEQSIPLRIQTPLDLPSQHFCQRRVQTRAQNKQTNGTSHRLAMHFTTSDANFVTRQTEAEQRKNQTNWLASLSVSLSRTDSLSIFNFTIPNPNCFTHRKFPFSFRQWICRASRAFPRSFDSSFVTNFLSTSCLFPLSQPFPDTNFL